MTTSDDLDAALDAVEAADRAEKATKDELLHGDMTAYAAVVGHDPGVLMTMRAIEMLIVKEPRHVRRRALAAALWRACADMNTHAEIDTGKIVLTEGGRGLSLELKALWPKDEPW